MEREETPFPIDIILVYRECIMLCSLSVIYNIRSGEIKAVE